MQYLLEEAELAEEKEQEKVQEKGKVVQGKVVKNKQAGWSAACGSPVCTIQNTTQNIKKENKVISDRSDLCFKSAGCFSIAFFVRANMKEPRWPPSQEALLGSD